MMIISMLSDVTSCYGVLPLHGRQVSVQWEPRDYSVSLNNIGINIKKLSGKFVMLILFVSFFLSSLFIMYSWSMSVFF